MRIAYVWTYGGHPFSYWLTNTDGHFECFGYLSRYYDVHVYAPAHFQGAFDRDNFTVHGEHTVEQLLDTIEAQGPWDAIVCYGTVADPLWPMLKLRSGNAVFCLDYAGGPFMDLDGNAHPAVKLFDHTFTAHETQATWLRERGVPASKARGVPTNRYRPIPGVPKLWHVIAPGSFTPGKRPILAAEYLERYGISKPSLFLGAMEHPAVVDMVRQGAIPLNKPTVKHRNRIELGERAPYAVMPLLYSASEICIVGSQEEAGPWVAMEAMACEVPTIVMSDCAWLVAEAFAALPGCFVVPPDTGAIYEAVEEILGNYEENARLARRSVVEKYSWWSQYQVTDQTLKNLVALKQAGQNVA